MSSSPLANPSPSGGYLPGATPLAPGQILAPDAAKRGLPTLPELLHALKRRLVLATFLGLLVGVGAAAALWLSQPRGKHQVRALVEIKLGDANPMAKAGKLDFAEGDFDSYKLKQERLLKGRTLLTRVIGNPGVAKLGEIRTADDPVRYLEETVRVKWIANLMEVSMYGDTPAELKTILDTLMVDYSKDSVMEENTLRAKNMNVMQKQLDATGEQIKVMERTLEALVDNQQAGATPVLSELQLEAMQGQYKLVADKLATAERDLKLHQANARVADDKLAQIEQKGVNAEDVTRFMTGSPQFTDLVAKVADAEERYAQARKVLEDPALRGQLAAIAAAKENLNTALARERPRYEKEARAFASAEATKAKADAAELVRQDALIVDALKQETTKLSASISELRKGSLTMHSLQEDLKPIKDRRATLNADIMELQRFEKLDPRVTIKEQATILLDQNLKQKVLLSIAAFLAGTTALMLAVAFLEWRSRRVDSVDQVVTDLGLRVIGTIPAFPSKQALKSGDAAQSQNWRFVLNESVNSARTMLLHTAKTQNMQVLMVTSAMQGEGKTSLASQLATSMATAGLRTLILDCDLRNPSMHKLFDAPLTPGCSEVLCQEIDVSDAVQPTSVPNLWLIPAGQCSNRVISALAQGHPLETLFNRLRGQFDFIVVDSCPVLPVADTLLVGQHVDGVLISILQDISQLPKVAAVSEKLTQLNIPLLGAVVNGVKPDIHAYGYNYVKQLPA